MVGRRDDKTESGMVGVPWLGRKLFFLKTSRHRSFSGLQIFRDADDLGGFTTLGGAGLRV